MTQENVMFKLMVSFLKNLTQYMSYVNHRVYYSKYPSWNDWMNCLQFIGDLPLVKVQYTEQKFQPSPFIASYMRKGVRVHNPSLGYFADTQF